ncbi:MAG TPA: APC family permease, partial [Firmicutes bacterium]|nr:APC family permease [Bacillota bacterium]
MAVDEKKLDLELEKRMAGAGRLKRSLKLLYVYALATGAIYTFMGYWDGMFLTATGPATGLSFLLLTILVLPIAFVYCELAAMMPSCGVELVYGTVCLNKHFGFWSTWLILAAWLAVPPAGMMAIIQWLNFAFGWNMTIYQIMYVSAGLLVVYCILNLFEIKIAGQVQTFMLFAALAGALAAAIVFLKSPTWSLSNYVPFVRTAFGGGGATGEGGWWGLAIGFAMLITPYFGFETVPNMVEEGTFPIKDMNKAIWGSV